MPLIIGPNRVVVSRGQEIKKFVQVVGLSDPVPVLLTTGPPSDMKGTERWHTAVWAEVRKRLSFLRNDLVVDAFSLFMTLVEDHSKDHKYPDDSAVAKALIAQLRQQHPERFLTEAMHELDRELKQQKDENPKTWELFAGVLMKARYEDPKIPPLFRRLDALARLLHDCLENLKKADGDDFDPICVAVTCVKGRFLVATNVQPPLKNNALAQAVAKDLYAMSMFGVKHPAELQERLGQGVDGQLLLSEEQLKTVQEANSVTDANKVLTWLKKDLKLPTAEAFAACLEFIPHIGFHAEMSLLAWLLTEKASPLLLTEGSGALLKELPFSPLFNEQIPARDSKAEDQAPGRFSSDFYIGISYLCCPHCYYTFHKYNQWGATYEPKHRPMAVRGYHTADKGGWLFAFAAQLPQPLLKREQAALKALCATMKALPLATFEDNLLHDRLKAEKAAKKKPKQERDTKLELAPPPKPVAFKIDKTQGRGQFVSRINKRQDRSPSPRRPVPHVCHVCGEETTQKCGRCFTVFYCSKECQTADWKTHKPVCPSMYTPPTHGLCPLCGKQGTVKCPQCNAVDYCGQKCMQDAWKDHKHVCKAN